MKTVQELQFTSQGLTVDGRSYIHQAQPQEIFDNWLDWAQRLAPAFAIAKGEVDEYDALNLAVRGRAYVFVCEYEGVVHGLLVAELVEYPKKRVCNIMAYAGRFRQFYTYLEVIELWALENGCEELRGYGEEPQMRLARHHGFEEIYRVYRKPLKRRMQ